MRRLADAERNADRRAAETVEEGNMRRIADAERNANRRAAETVEEGNMHRIANVQCNANRRAAETVDQVIVRRQANLQQNNMRIQAARDVHLNSARNRNNAPDLHYSGEMNSVCEHCGAIKFQNETFFKCCHGGKVALEPLSPYPEDLKNLMTGDSQDAKNFQANIRKYNSAFSFASLGANIRPPPGRGPPCFRVCGQICHRSGSYLINCIFLSLMLLTIIEWRDKKIQVVELMLCKQYNALWTHIVRLLQHIGIWLKLKPKKMPVLLLKIGHHLL
jgi:hypothetical protein